MPLNQPPTPPLDGDQVAFRLRQRTFSTLGKVRKLAAGLRKDVRIALNRDVAQATSDALGAADLADMQAAYAGLKTYIECCGAACPDLPTLPSTTNP